MADYTSLPSLSSGNIITASYLSELADNLRVISTHSHTGASGMGSASQVSASATSGYVFHHELSNFLVFSQNNWDTGDSSGYIFGAAKKKTLGSAASLNYYVYLYRGAYTMKVMFDNNISNASTTFLLNPGLDPSTLGTIVTAGSSTPQRSAVCNIFFNCPITGSFLLQLNTAANTDFRLIAINIAMTGSY